MLFRWVMLYALQEGDMDVQEGYMLKKIMMFIVATNVVANRLERRSLMLINPPPSIGNFLV